MTNDERMTKSEAIISPSEHPPRHSSFELLWSFVIRHSSFWGTLVIFLLVVAAYWPALRGQFVWDDALLVDKNPLVKGELGLRSVWFQTDFPLSVVAFWLQWLAWGKSAAGYHIVNVLLHGAGAVLLWRVLARLRIPGAWLAAVIFAVHPVCVASVAWISELKNTLSLVFYLLSVLWYLRSNERRALVQEQASRFTFHVSRFTPGGWYCLSLTAFLLALLTKTSTVMLPVVLLACAWWQRGRITRQDCLRAGPYFLLALAFGLVTIWFQKHGAISGATAQTENFWGRLAGAGWAAWFYLGKALLPLNLNLIYPRWQIDATAPLAYVPLLVLCGAFFVCWRFRRNWGRPALFGLGCFTINLLPVVGFLDMYFLAISRVSDHFQYLPLIAVVALVVAGLSSVLPGKLLRFAGPLLVATLAVSTFQRAQVFARDETLWRDTLTRNPAAWTAHNNLGCLLAAQQKYDEAIRHFEDSLRLHPKNAQAHCNLARALALQNRFAEAEPHFRTALEIKPNDAEIHRSFASALAGYGNKQAALVHLREAVRLAPDLDSRLELASLLHKAGQDREAADQYRQALSLKSDSLDALNNLAWILATCPDDSVRAGIEAVRLAEKACQLTGYMDARPLGTLAAAYAEAGRFTEAVATAQKAVEAAAAAAAGDPRLAAANRQLLRWFQAGKPWRQPHAKGDK
ncbi:MAG: hypothetical protein DME25_04695 [Verrucomicrobia bacterium]|nr:MAG: hypothetical protein DME25_04695 [Verrucomicrobiota bacterium]